MAMATYDPTQFGIIFGASILGGFSDGSFLTVQRNEESFSIRTGVDGTTARAKNANKSARITLTLMATSESNDVLAAAAQADELTSSGVQSFLMRDNNGTTLVTAARCWVTKPADIEYGREVGDRQWVLETDNCQIFVGSTVLA